MGQPIVVTEKASACPGGWRFEANRVLTGMEHERYAKDREVLGVRPPDELARRLFVQGAAEDVHVYGNVVTARLARGQGPDGIREIIEGLYTYYREGVTPALP